MVKRIRYYLYIIGLGCMTGWSFIALLFWSKQIDFNPIIYSTQYFYVWGSLYIGLPLGCSILWSITLRRINEKGQKTIYICTSIWFVLFLLLIGWNKMYWNYYFKRPHPFSELQASKNIQQCFSVSNIDYTIPSGRKSLTFSFTPPHKKPSLPSSNHYYNFLFKGFSTSR